MSSSSFNSVLITTTFDNHNFLNVRPTSYGAAEYIGGPGGIPEPATWGLMIAGFGMAGAVLRRRRDEIVAA